MSEIQPVKVVELRNYLIKPRMRDRFIEYFQTHFIDSQRKLGGLVLGAYRIRNFADRFFWIRGFSGIEARSRFLPAFYGGEVWKRDGPAANAMMLEWHRAHLLRPLDEIDEREFGAGKELLVVDFYEARAGRLGALRDFFATARREKAIPAGALWLTDTAVNDFPALPVIQNENLLVVMTGYRDESQYESRSKEIESRLEQGTSGAVEKHERLILDRAARVPLKKR
jgi:hypothetical protein